MKAWLAGVFDRAASTYDGPGGGYHDRFGERLVVAAGIGANDRVLDVACGRGAAVAPAARAVGSGGRVLGVDLSPEMAKLTAQRAAADRLSVEVAVMDAERLAVPERSFDKLLCGFGIFFLPDPEQALVGFRRALVPGGTVALSTWGAEDPRWAWEDELLADATVERRAVQRSFDDPHELEVLLTGAGFHDVRVETSELDIRIADADEWWAWKWSYSFRGILEQLPEVRVQRLRDDARALLADMDDGRGAPLRLEALFALGRR